MPEYTQKDDARRIGVLGSPNFLDTFTMDVMHNSIEESLYGKMLKFQHEEKCNGEVSDLVVLSQVSEMQNRNVWHEQTGMRSLIKIQGGLKNLSGDADLKLCQLSFLGSYCDGEKWIPRNIGTPPRSGTSVEFVTQDDIDKASGDKDDAKWFMGNIPDTDLHIPFLIQHFGPVNAGGVGEARMYGVFGQSGSGKSIVAAEIIAGFSRFEDMGILIIDPQGEFYGDKFGRDTDFDFSFHELIHKTGKEVIKADIDFIKLEDDADLFVELLNSRDLLENLGGLGTKDKIDQCTAYLVNTLKNKMSHGSSKLDTYQNSFKLDTYSYEDLYGDIHKILGEIYQKTSVEDKQKHLKKVKDDYRNDFKECIALFKLKNDKGNTKRTLGDLLKSFLEGKMVILSMVGKSHSMKYEDKALVMNQIVNKVIKEAETRFNSENESKMNGLIVLDEAHRYAKQKSQDEEIPEVITSLRKMLESATRETRKYSLGWLFITQSIVGFSKDIYRQLTDVWYGYGLTIGRDVDHVKSRVGDEAYKLYAHFPNPKQTGIYNYLVYGGSVSLGTMGKPIAIEAFSTFKAFLDANGLGEDKPS